MPSGLAPAPHSIMLFTPCSIFIIEDPLLYVAKSRKTYFLFLFLVDDACHVFIIHNKFECAKALCHGCIMIRYIEGCVFEACPIAKYCIFVIKIMRMLENVFKRVHIHQMMHVELHTLQEGTNTHPRSKNICVKYLKYPNSSTLIIVESI